MVVPSPVRAVHQSQAQHQQSEGPSGACGRSQRGAEPTRQCFSPASSMCHAGYVTSIMGRRRPLPRIHARDQQLRAQAERQAVNFVVQGTLEALSLPAATRMSVSTCVSVAGSGEGCPTKHHRGVLYSCLEAAVRGETVPTGDRPPGRASFAIRTFSLGAKPGSAAPMHAAGKPRLQQCSQHQSVAWGIEGRSCSSPQSSWQERGCLFPVWTRRPPLSVVVSTCRNRCHAP